MAVDRQMWRQALRAVAGLTLALLVLLMHTQVADAVMASTMTTPTATATASATTSSGDMAAPGPGSMDSAPLVMTRDHKAAIRAADVTMGHKATAPVGYVSRPGHPTPDPGGCTGHSRLCTATVHLPGIKVLPPTACPASTQAALVPTEGVRASAPARQAPEPPAPEQALLQIWRC